MKRTDTKKNEIEKIVGFYVTQNSVSMVKSLNFTLIMMKHYWKILIRENT